MVWVIVLHCIIISSTTLLFLVGRLYWSRSDGLLARLIHYRVYVFTVAGPYHMMRLKSPSEILSEVHSLVDYSFLLSSQLAAVDRFNLAFQSERFQNLSLVSVRAFVVGWSSWGGYSVGKLRGKVNILCNKEKRKSIIHNIGGGVATRFLLMPIFSFL